MSFFRKRDRSGFPLMTDQEWKDGETPESIADYELLKWVGIIVLIIVMVAGAILLLGH